MGVMEVIASDFARLETETTTAKAEATYQYNQLMID